MTQSKQIGLATCTCAHISPSNENIRQVGSIVKVLQENKKLDEDKPLQKTYTNSCSAANIIPSCGCYPGEKISIFSHCFYLPEIRPKTPD
jgi:hypothetical protein